MQRTLQLMWRGLDIHVWQGKRTAAGNFRSVDERPPRAMLTDKADRNACVPRVTQHFKAGRNTGYRPMREDV